MLLLDNGVPDFWVTLFVSKTLRAQAQNTIEHALTSLRHFRSWEEYNERDLPAEFRSGRFLSDGDIQSIADHCAYQVKAFEKWATKAKRGSSVSVANLLAMKAPVPLKTVQFDTQYNRLTTVTNYLSFVAETVCRVRSDQRNTQPQIEQMKKKLLGSEHFTSFQIKHIFPDPEGFSSEEIHQRELAAKEPGKVLVIAVYSQPEDMPR